MHNKVMAALAAGGLLVGAGLVTSIVSAPGAASAQEEVSGTDEGHGFFARGIEFLSGVLDGLVDEGTITSDQADALLEAVDEAATELHEQREALREQIHGYLEDGVLTSEEAANLPDDHWLLGDVFDEAWEDGELTVEEIREARPHPRRDAFRHGVRFGALLDDGGIDQGEYDGLPDTHPLKQVDVTGYLEDGVITIDELREIRDELRSDTGA